MLDQIIKFKGLGTKKKKKGQTYPRTKRNLNFHKKKKILKFLDKVKILVTWYNSNLLIILKIQKA